MARISKKCADAIKAAFKGKRRLTEEDTEFILNEINRRMSGKQKDFDLSDDAWLVAAKEAARDIRKAAYLTRRNHKLGLLAQDRVLKVARLAGEVYGDTSLGLQAAMVGLNRPLKKGKVAVSAEQDVLFRESQGALIEGLEREGLLVDYNGGKLDREIARGIEKETDPNAPGTKNEIAKRIAKIVVKARKQAFNKWRRAGGTSEELPGYITRGSHDPIKIGRVTPEEWKAFIGDQLHEERTFGRVDDRVTFMKEAYATLSTGEAYRVGKGSDMTIEFRPGKGSVAARGSQHRVLHFRDADAWSEYNPKFGMRSLRESISHDFRTMADDTAFMRGFGPNPKSTFDAVREKLVQEARAAGDPKQVRRLRRGFLDTQMRVIDGSSRIPGNLTLAQVTQWVTMLQNVSKLGFATISSIADVATQAAAIRYWDGSGILSPFAKSLNNFFNGLDPVVRKEVAARFGVGVDGAIGAMSSRFSIEDGVPGIAASINRWFFKLNLLQPWTDTNKAGMAAMIANDLAGYAGKTFKQLPPQQQRILRDFGIEDAQWEVAKNAIDEASNGTKYLFPDKIQDLGDDVFVKNGLDPTLDRDTLTSSIRLLYHDMAEFAVPTPGGLERAILTQGYDKGSPIGMALTMFSQFKAFPVTIISKVHGRLKYGGADGKWDKAGTALMISQATLLGYAALAAKDVFKGRTPRSPLDLATWVAAMAQGGGAGIFGDFLFGESNRFGQSLTETAAGPTAGTVSDIADLLFKIRDGDDPSAKALRTATTLIPNLFYTKAAMEYLFLYNLQEMVNPGYLDRTDKRLQRETGQRHIFPPSEVIKRGGGFR